MASLFPNSPETEQFNFLPSSRFILICTATALGALTHIAWDSFTHASGWMVQHAPWLDLPILNTRWGTLRFYKFLQHGSTALGLLVLTRFARRHEFLVGNSAITGWKSIAALSVASAAAGLILSLSRLGFPVDFDSIRAIIGVAIVSSATFGAVGTTFLCMAWHVQKGRIIQT